MEQSHPWENDRSAARQEIQTPGNYPEESIQHSKHGESLKSRRNPQFVLWNPAGGGVITAFTRARRLSLSCATAVCANYPTSWRNNFIFISHTTRFPEWFFPLSFFTRILYAAFLSLLYPIRATCPAHLILLDLITRIIFDEMYSS